MKVRVAHCPRCRKPVEFDEPFFPFCSQRCRLVDLGQWLNGDYRLRGERVSLPEDPGWDGDRDE